jgi:alpha-D-xyloside xylohydrolase
VGGMLDFTNPEAGRWWNNHMHSLYEQGIAFIKNDDGEYLPTDAHSALGIGGDELHNLYGFFYGKALFEGMSALDDRRPLIYARSVWAGSQRFPALFLGDQKPSFECLRRTMRAGLNLSLAGFAYWTADVFGLDGKTTPETHMRYAQWALFVPVARYFWRPPEIDDTRFPWSHGPQVEDNFRRHAELRYRLLPYYSALGWEAWRTGMPILRPLLLEFQDDPRLIDIWDQVMLGSGLMLAPVVQAGAVRRRIVLPRGQWHEFWSTASHEGDKVIEIDAPMDRLPILVRGGTILPLGPALTHIPDGHRFDRIHLHVWPPYPAQGILFDDDGISRAYQRGAFSITACSAEGDAQRLAVRIGPAQGRFPAQGETREVEFVLHRTAAPRRVRVNGRPAEGWSHDAQEERTIIPVSCPVRSETIVEAEF